MARPRGRRTSESWDATVRRAREQFPAAEQACVDLKPLLDRDDVLGKLLLDLGRVGYTPVRRGSRPVPPLDDLVQRLRGLFRSQDIDYSVEPFPVAFKTLARERSFSHLSRMTALSRTQVERLVKGQVAPTAAEMEAIAAAFCKPPAYFREYRTAFICAIAAEALEQNPDRSAVVYRKLLTTTAAAG